MPHIMPTYRGDGKNSFQTYILKMRPPTNGLLQNWSITKEFFFLERSNSLDYFVRPCVRVSLYIKNKYTNLFKSAQKSTSAKTVLNFKKYVLQKEQKSFNVLSVKRARRTIIQKVAFTKIKHFLKRTSSQ